MIREVYPTVVQEAGKNNEVKLLDVRTPEEFRGIHAKGAINIQLDDISFDRVSQEMDLQKGDTLFIICRSGKRSMVACEILQRQGAPWDLVNVAGGTIQWAEEGHPTERS